MKAQGLRILVLDDDEARHRAFARKFIGNIVDRCHTATEAIGLLESNSVYDVICLDHDLGGQQMADSGPGTGYEVACWLESHPDKQAKTIILHTFNPSGARNMRAVLPQALWLPGVWVDGKELSNAIASE
jgi:CheY-like chemotaxis protein